jgi:4-hydroxy-3-methylbut-2-en-1-yl diphosphate reductase
MFAVLIRPYLRTSGMIKLLVSRLQRPNAVSFADVQQQEAETKLNDGRTVRRSLNQTGRYTRQPNNNAESQSLMDTHGVGYSSSGLVAQMREAGNAWQQGEVTVKLAKAYGYCWGVERAVRMAYEAKRSFPDRKLYITNEIIHNPEVNQASMHILALCCSSLLLRPRLLFKS